MSEPTQEAMEIIRKYIRPEVVDDLLSREIPALGGTALSEFIETDPEQALFFVKEELFNWEKANGQ